MLITWSDALAVFALAFTAYFVLWNGSQIILGLISGLSIRHYVRTRSRRNLALSSQVASPPLVSVIVPAYNEAVTVVDSVRALLALDYEPHEIVVVNDGSSDETLAVLKTTFHLLAAPVAFVQPLNTAPLRGIYRSTREPALVVIDKENGGSKADAINAGVNAAAGILVLTIDADTVIDPEALRRAVLPFLEDPTLVAVGGNIAVANGCRMKDGKVIEVILPQNWLARFQIVEYMRSFLLSRVAFGSRNAITILSGAFGLFRRDAVIAVNGYDGTAIGEDMDLTVRLQKYYRERRQPFRIAFDPFPLCSTQVPEDWWSLRSQRLRWRRGLLQVLWRHRRMIGNPRFGLLGTIALPYTLLFEGVGPLIEIIGYVVTTAAATLGFLDWPHYRLLMLVSLLFGIAATLVAVFLNDVATRRYLHGRDIVLLVLIAILENCGYRQLNSWWSCLGTVRMLTRSRGWGVIKRRVFEGVETRPLILLLVCLLGLSASALAQDDVLVRAREAATSGRRAEALAMLETRLAESPRDVDARLLYGLVLSWEGRYDEARPVLQEVLTQTPNYTDARVALMNVEYWSGHSTEARTQAEQILSANPGNPTARAVRDRLEAAARPWWAKTSYTLDAFSDGADPWNEFSLSLTRRTPIGSVIVRASKAARFGLDDQLIEAEFYPRFRPGTYAFIAAGFSSDADLYPYDRYAFDLYQSLGHGFEVSGGARFLDFGTVTEIYVGTLTKYVGNWMFTGKIYRVPGEGELNSTSYHGQMRRYFGSDGTSYGGFVYSHGFSREEIRSLDDLAQLHSDSVRGEFDIVVGRRLRIDAATTVSYQDRADRYPVWQTTITGGLSVLF